MQRRSHGRDDTGRHHHDPRGDRMPGGGGPGPRMRGRRGPRGRAQRGDVRAAVLLLLAEEPMHGYQLMQAISDRSGGRWSPSPGAIYPTINQLEDEGLVAVTADAGRTLTTLTDVGRARRAEGRDAWTLPFAGYHAAEPGADLRQLSRELHEAIRPVGRSGTDA